MRWKVLIVRPWTNPIDEIVATVSRAGIDGHYERVDTKPALLAALERDEFELVMYDPASNAEVPLEVVYTHAPAAAVVMIGEVTDMADELARLVVTRTDVID